MKRWGDKVRSSKKRCESHSTPNAKERKGKERKGKNNTNTNTKSVFNFRKSMLDYGFNQELVDEWLAVRNKKKAINSEFVLKLFLSTTPNRDYRQNHPRLHCVDYHFTHAVRLSAWTFGHHLYPSVQ